MTIVYTINLPTRVNVWRILCLALAALWISNSQAAVGLFDALYSPNYEIARPESLHPGQSDPLICSQKFMSTARLQMER